MGAIVFGGLAGALYVANLEVCHHPRGSYAQMSATFTSSFFQLSVLVWWVAVFGFSGDGGLYQVVGNGIVFLSCGGWWNLVPLTMLSHFYGGGSRLWILNTMAHHI